MNHVCYPRVSNERLYALTGISSCNRADAGLANTTRLYLTINNELEKKFREEVAKRLGMRKGNLQLAIEQAIELWLKFKK